MAKTLKALVTFIILLILVPVIIVGSAFLGLLFYEKHKDKIKPVVRRKLRLLRRAKGEFETKVNELKTSEVVSRVREQVENVRQDVEERVGDVKLTKRQKEIVDHLEQAGELGMKELSDIFGQVTPRTLRRDMSQLENLGIVKQLGKTKNSLYQLIKNAQNT